MEETFVLLPDERPFVDMQLGENGESTAVLIFSAETPAVVVPVTFIMTQYRIHVAPSPDAVVRPPVASIPLRMIESYATSTDPPFSVITIQTKHVWSFAFGFPTDAQFRRVLQALGALLAPVPLQKQPAFEICASLRKAAEASGDPAIPIEWQQDAGWSLFSQAAELHRQLAPHLPVVDADGAAAAPEVPPVSECGVDKDLRPWYRVTTLSQPSTSYGSFATYPAHGVVVPNTTSDELLLKASVARSRARVPAISYVCLRTGAVLARCSQPLRQKSIDLLKLDAQVCSNLCNTYTEYSANPNGKAVAAKKVSTPAVVPPAIAAGDSNGAKAPVDAPPSLFDDAGAPAVAKPVVPPPAAPRVAPPSLLADDDWTPIASQTAPPGSSSTGAQTGSTAATASGVTAGSSRVLKVYDLRPMAAARGNLALGGGYESGPAYDATCTVAFCGIDNIHGVTSAWQKLRQLVANHAGRGLKLQNSSPVAQTTFLKELNDSSWLLHIQRVLVASWQIAEALTTGQNVLTHCTDGWDRTAQATSLAMIMLDPYFRTVRGFCIVIEKEFCSFGHKFAERSAHDVNGETIGTAHISGGLSDVDRQQDQQQHKKQTSPIFVQWLDCVYQLVRQFPSKFEFTPSLLEFIGVHLYSCYFGTFLCNCNKERILEGVTTRTLSLWSEVERRVSLERKGASRQKARFVNPIYTPPVAPSANFDPLQPSLGSKRLVFWEELYLKYDPDTWAIEPSLEAQLLAALSPVAEPPTTWRDWEVAVARTPARREAETAAYLGRDATIISGGSSAATADTLGKAGGAVAAPVDLKAKQCWKCCERFGLFKSSTRCALCGRLYCSKCIFSDPSGNTKYKYCESCTAVVTTEDE